MKLAFLGIIGLVLIISGAVIKTSFAQSDEIMPVNMQQLAWEIRQQTGINCGGYYETEGVVQNCYLTYSNKDGVALTLTTDIENMRDEIETVIHSHKAVDTLPADYPVPPTKVPVLSVKDKYQAALTDTERLNIIAESLGITSP